MKRPENFYDDVYGSDVGTEGMGSGWIQWKGTEVCMDVRCVCGFSCHVDTHSFYFFECPDCEQVFAVGETVRLLPLNEEQQAYVRTLPTVVRGEDD